CSPMTSLKTSIKTITYLSDTGCLEIQGASLFIAIYCYVENGIFRAVFCKLVTIAIHCPVPVQVCDNPAFRIGAGS
ncbi:hypothetical protein LG212_22950, partial [Escherichia coli]|uniref:hypothetical protein n=1 Tax=Escherichia coli TaxID=562 RepID=UPI001CFB2DD1